MRVCDGYDPIFILSENGVKSTSKEAKVLANGIGITSYNPLRSTNLIPDFPYGKIILRSFGMVNFMNTGSFEDDDTKPGNPMVEMRPCYESALPKV